VGLRILRTIEEQLALALATGERCRTLKLAAGFVKAAESRQKVSADARQEVIVLKCGLRGYLIDECESGLWTKGHGHSHCAIQINDRRRREPGEVVVEPGDARPIRLLRRAGFCMACGDRGLQSVAAGESPEFFSPFERGETTPDKELFPQGAILIEDQDRLSLRADSRP
jgi:hypothetical protein